MPAGNPGAAAPAAVNLANQADDAQAPDDVRQGKAARNRSRHVERRPAGHTEGTNHTASPAPVLLSPEQFDRQRGKIFWPEALRDEALAAARRQLEQLSVPGQPTSPDGVQDRSREIGELTEEIKEQLKTQIHDIPPAEYIAARKFLDGLAGELRSAVVMAGQVADSRE
jgi:hypothetical protein